MKKLLTVLLVIAVMFTFSFGSTVAFAADGDSYSYSDWADKLRAEKDAQLGYLANYKAQALTKYDFNDEGFVKATDFSQPEDEIIAGYTKVALSAAADAVIDDLEVTMDKNISAFLNTEANYKDKEPTATRVESVVLGTFAAYAITGTLTAITVTNATTMMTALQGYTEDLDKAQAPETEKAVTAKVDAVNVADYNSSDKDYKYTAPVDPAVIGTVEKGSSLTAADAVTAIIDDAKDAIKDGKKEDTDAEKRVAYETAYAEFKTQLDKVDTKADEDFKDITNDTNLSAAVDKYAAYGYELASDLMNKYKDGTGLKSKVSWETEIKGKLSAFWDENSKDSKDGKLFDIAVSDYTKITRAEATSIYNAMKDEVTKSKAVITGWINNNDFANASVLNVYDSETKFYQTLDRAMDAADKYADVVKEGNKLKAEYRSGVKQYVDSKVDEAVKKAEEFVYGDLYKDERATDTADYKTPKAYIEEAANDINDNEDGLTNLKEDGAKLGFDNFKDAINDAAKKIYENGIYGSKNAPTKKVAAGSDKTADEDLVYLKETYATSEASDWEDTAEDTIDALKDAQSKAEIESIMKKAAEDFGKLLKKADESDVDKARDAYKDALEGYIKQMYGLLDSKGDYSYAYLGAATGTTLPSNIKADCPLYTKGADLIDDANTVEAVKTAYADAQALVNGAKKNSELKDMKKAVEKKITALPGEGKIEASDLDAVKEAYAALAEYADLAGYSVSPIGDTDLNDLAGKFTKVLSKYKDQIEDEAEALFDKMDEVDTRSDADLAKYTAYKAEAQALIDKVDALNDDIDDINDDEYLKTNGKDNKLDKLTFTANSDYGKIDAALELDIVAGEGNFYNYEIENAKRLLVEANKPNATAAQMKAALEAFNALTERQQLALDQNNDYYYQIAKAIADKQGTTVKELKITAKSTAKKGSITVKWTVKGSADIDGYEVWKSTKHSKGYKKAFTTTKQTYKNSKGLKKGTRYYYKVRAYKMVDGKKITSDWSNKARRIAK